MEEINKEIKLTVEIQTLLNKYSRENKSDTPDFILADYLFSCLKAYEEATNKRDEWYGRSGLSELYEDIDAFVLEMAND